MRDLLRQQRHGENASRNRNRLSSDPERFEARFVDADALLELLSRASQRDQLQFALEEYLHPNVLVIDEIGYLNHRADAANVLLQVVNARHLEKGSTVFTTNSRSAAVGASCTTPTSSRQSSIACSSAAG